MKILIFSLSFFLCSSFNFTDNHNHQAMMDSSSLAPKMFEASDTQYVEPSSVEVKYLKVKSMQTTNFSGENLTKLQTAFKALEVVVNTQEFKERVLNFKNSVAERSFASNEGLSNEQIFEAFMEGREQLDRETPHEMNFYLKLYNKRWSSVVGWTEPGIKTINVNWKFFRTFKPSDVAGNLAHEWTHKIGFGHKSSAEHDSAPYAVGYIVREMAERYLKGEELH